MIDTPKVAFFLPLHFTCAVDCGRTGRGGERRDLLTAGYLQARNVQTRDREIEISVIQNRWANQNSNSEIKK